MPETPSTAAEAMPPRARTLVLTALAMLAFAGNSILCRSALRHTTIDPATFTAVRIVSGGAVLWVIVRVRRGGSGLAGSWPSAIALFVYAAAFSYAYVTLVASTGALLLFGAVQATMIGRALATGERLGATQWTGVVTAVAGLVGFLLPGLSAPPLRGAALMLAAGVAWGVYSLRGRQGGGDPTAVTAGNFVRASTIAILLAVAMSASSSWPPIGLAYAFASGALTSGLGYAVWYAAVRGLSATAAATVQLSVPVIAALGGVLLLGEGITLRLVLASIAILGGIALVIVRPRSGS